MRVVDLTTILLGPAATQMPGDFGADVVKVESPGGNALRSAGPPPVDNRMGAMYLTNNRNKRGLVLDLKDPRPMLVIHGRLLLNHFPPVGKRKAHGTPCVLTLEDVEADGRLKVQWNATVRSARYLTAAHGMGISLHDNRVSPG